MKKISILISFLSLFLVSFFGLNTMTGCACMTNEEILRDDLFGVKKVIMSEKEKNGKYPTYKELKNIDIKNVDAVKDYNKRGLGESGIFYAQLEGGSNFILKGYFPRVTFFGLELPISLEGGKN